MADITRRTFGNLRTEALKRLGHAAAGATYQGRVEHLLYSAYLELSLTFFHHELVTYDTSLVASTSVPTLALPANCYAVMGVAIRSAANAWIGPLRRSTEHSMAKQDQTTASTGQPDEWARRGANLWFDKVASTALKIDLLYYKTPDAVDFTTSDTSELHWLFDEMILQRALSLGWPTRWRFDLESVQRELLTDVLGRTLHAPLGGTLLSPEGPRAADDVGASGQRG